MKINMCKEKCIMHFSDLLVGDVFFCRDDVDRCWVQMKITPNNEGNVVILSSGAVYELEEDCMVERVEAELNIL